MKVRSHHQVWALKGEEIEACLCIQPVEGGYWLTNLLVASQLRSQGRATALLAFVRAQVEGPIWLFCNPALMNFYRSVGYIECVTLPESLADRLNRYRRTKHLTALCNASPGGTA